ncbi:hypothetical protein ACEWY4_014017 [Coilia grayii]|uniref:C2H2-type domain-containing protein n=1 Tax=Coilia grayii TaxID=363190 RepID=A0ABD1JR67_9TELE
MGLWVCKVCGLSLLSRFELLKHWKLKHGHQVNRFRHPCPYSNCPCTFRLWNSLLRHVYRSHKAQNSLKTSTSSKFCCQLCTTQEFTNEHEYFRHVNEHLRKHESVTCMFKGCEFNTNVYNTFHTHKYRKHKSYTLSDFKTEIVTLFCLQNSSVSDINASVADPDAECETDFVACDLPSIENLPELIQQNIASVILKLEHILFVPATSINELIGEFHQLLSSSVPITFNSLSEVLNNRNMAVSERVVKELSEVVSNPLTKAFAKDGPLATACKRKKYYEENFHVVNPVEYILDPRTNRTFQYIPILPSLQQLLNNSDVLNGVLQVHHSQLNLLDQVQFRSIRHGSYHKNNVFFSDGGLKLSISLYYVDDFELCNPLGTSRNPQTLWGILDFEQFASWIPFCSHFDLLGNFM